MTRFPRCQAEIRCTRRNSKYNSIRIINLEVARSLIGGPMPATTTISTQTRVLGEDSQEILFRPGQPGFVSVHSVPAPNVAHTETGLLASITLRRPGSTSPLARATYKLHTQSLLLSYNATAADLTTPGDWTCEVSNESLDPITFTTDVTFPINIPLSTASIDIEFLNLVLAKVVDAAAVQIHLQSSSDGSDASRLSLSQDIAALLKLPTVIPFNIPDATKSVLDIPFVFRILNLDSDPEYPIVFLSTDPLSLKVELLFDTANAKLVAEDLPLPDINITLFNIEVTVGFDGGFEPVCNAIAHMAFDNIDFSGDVISGVQDAINQKVQDIPQLRDKKSVRAQIDLLFTAMLRLGQNVQIQGYKPDGQALTVTYFVRTT
jgi:hypothetical protein